MKYDHTFDSGRTKYEKEFEIDLERFSPLTVFFQNEGVVLQADRHGCAIFLDEDGNELYRERATHDNGYFGEVLCCVSGSAISVCFPTVEWIDHYPNCDGEYDRWSKRIVAKHYVRFDIKK